MKPCTFLILALLSLDSTDSVDVDVTSPVTELIEKFNPHTSRDCAILSVGGPELMRYSMVSDFLETGVLELSYVEFGLNYADFSIGIFQMKPSFVEQLEVSVCGNPQLLTQYQKLITYPAEDDQMIRAERIRRIKSPEYQYLILGAFYDHCMMHYCSYLEGRNSEDIVRFVGTAYNMGFNKSVEEILQYQPRENFPYGAKYKGDQYAYSSVSAEIFKQLIKSLCKNSYSTFLQDYSYGLARNYP